VCNLDGLTEDKVFVADDSADDVETLRAYPRHARGVIEGIDHFCSRTAVPG
jgi:hypothetical protein